MAASEAAIEAGRRYYEAKRYKPALEQFTRAMKLCSCARGLKRERCSCKNFEEVASRSGSIFKEAMYNCKCSVSQTFNKCDKTTHIQALDYRAATFEALDELGRARKDAEWILELAPRLPDGYLRLGKIARLQKNPEFAWKVYNAGIEVGLDNGTSNSRKMEQLYKARQPLHTRFIRKDPLHLPIEIIQLIFSFMDLISLAQCIQVSKTWNETLTASGNERLWRALVWAGPTLPRRPPRIEALRRLLTYSHNDVRKVVIEDAKKFGLTQAKFLAFLNSSKNLEHLVLLRPYENLELPIVLDHLKHLVLSGFDIGDLSHNMGSNRFHRFVAKVAGSLENLSLHGVPMEWGRDTLMPMMPNLKNLKLVRNASQIYLVSIIDILDHAPHLEQLCLDSVRMDDTLLEDRVWEHRGPNLKVVRIVESRGRTSPSLEHGNSSESIGAHQVLFALNGGTTLRHLDISYRWEYTETDPPVHELLEGHYEGREYEYDNLQSLRLGHMALCPEKAERIFGSTLRQGNLHTFDIVFPKDTLHGQAGLLSTEHLAGYAWLKGAESIRYMGIFGFSFPLFYIDEKNMPLVNFLASFPNLEVLDIDSQNYEVGDLFVVIRDILKATNLKTLYHRNVKGTMLEQLQKLAGSQGVELVWGERPRQWPMPLDQ